MSRRPPSARMREIKRSFTRVLPAQETDAPVSVEEALAVVVPVSEALAVVDVPVSEVPTVVDVPAGGLAEGEALIPEYDKSMRKDDLQEMARRYSLDDSGTKAEIVARLDAYFL
jgi:hypothetical protein